MGLADETLRAVTEAGYETPTPIQKQAVPVVLQGRDVMGIAQTGTGKTAGFTLPMIDILSQGRARARMPRSLILEPTRELAAQVAESFETYGKYHKLSMALLIGGVSFEDQNKALDRGVDVLIATPGRLLDHFERGRLMMSGVEIFVVDEADRMLDMGFIPDIERICKLMPQRHQTLFFSATMPPEIKRLSDTFLDDPKQIEVARPTSPAETVEQFLVMEKSKEPKAKRNRLRALIGGEEIASGIVFCNRKKDVDIVAKSLKKHGHSAAALHGDMDQGSRMDVLTAFKANDITILVASDVAARGLDIPAVSHVFNFDVPNHAEDYIHRIGRTGRAGRSGRAFTISSPLDAKFLAAVHDMIGKSIPLFDQGDAEDVEALLSEADDKPRKRGRRRGGRRNNRDKNQETKTEKQDDDLHPPRGHDARTAQKHPHRKEKAERDERPQKPRRTEHGDKIPEPNGIKGLGDHTPAFLLQPVVIPGSRKSSKDEDAEAEKPKKARKKAAPKKEAAKKAADKKDSADKDKPKKKASAKKDGDEKKKKTSSRKAKKEEPAKEQVVDAPESEVSVEAEAEAPAVEEKAEEKPKRRRTRRTKKTETAEQVDTSEETPAETPVEADAGEAASEPSETEAKED